jgi:hypothetical protein
VLQVKPTSSIKKVKAQKGQMLPIFYNGSIINIGDQDWVEIDIEALGYEPKIQFQKALAQKNIFEMGAK